MNSIGQLTKWSFLNTLLTAARRSSHPIKFLCCDYCSLSANIGYSIYRRTYLDVRLCGLIHKYMMCYKWIELEVSKEALSLNEIATNNYSSFTLYPHIISYNMLRKDENGNVETNLFVLKFCLTSHFCIIFLNYI